MMGLKPFEKDIVKLLPYCKIDKEGDNYTLRHTIGLKIILFGLLPYVTFKNQEITLSYFGKRKIERESWKLVRSYIRNNSLKAFRELEKAARESK